MIPLDDEIAEALIRQFGFTRSQDDKRVLRGHLDKRCGEFLTGDWLEVFMGGLLHKHANVLEIQDLQHSVYIRPNRENATMRNEFDVAFLKDLTFNMVECKTGAQNPEDVIYKTSMVIQQFNALRVRTFLVTNSPLFLDERTGQIKEHIKERADLYRCRLITAKAIERLANNPDIATIKDVFGWK